MMYRIILIDDDTETLETLAAYYDWRGLGIELARTADNGVDGLAAILDAKPDIVLIDIKMPGMDGLTVIRETQKRGRGPYFIVISGYADFDYAQTALRLSVGDYLLKPYSPEDLENAFRKAVTELDRRIPNLIMPRYGLPRSGSGNLSYPIDSEKAIMNVIFVGEKADLAPALDCFIQRIFAMNDVNDALACVSILRAAVVRPLIERKISLSIDQLEGIRWDDRDLPNSLRQFLLAILEKAYSLIHSESTIHSVVIAAEKYIRTHYQEKLTLDIVAKAVSITPTYLSSLFPKSLGMSFISYVNKVRLERAQEFLRDPSMDLHTVAEQAGFSDVKYFSQVFKRGIGSTINQYRGQVLNDPPGR
ncbi:MAG: response regulator [Peptococcaceae bacterium]|jgi:two-component system response regulator YesN|nr:response regulator [Peptococcaceae bacterium]